MLKIIYKLFLISVFEILISCQSDKNTTDLILAIDNYQTNDALNMIKDGVDLEQADSLGLYPIHWAAKRALPRVTKALIQKKCDINAINCNGYTALNYAIRSGNTALVKILLGNGAEVYKNELSNLSDGPFVDKPESGLYAYYLKHDSLESRSYISRKFLNTKENTFKGWAGDTTTYFLKDSKTPAWQVKTKEPIFVLGDILITYKNMV
jgi:hypothetical protein